MVQSWVPWWWRRGDWWQAAQWLPACGYILTAVNYSFFSVILDVWITQRQCATNQYLRKENDPHRYCTGECAVHTKCGPVTVPEEHLQVRLAALSRAFPPRVNGRCPVPGASGANFPVTAPGHSNSFVWFLWRSGASLALCMLGEHSTILRLHFLPTTGHS